MRATTEARQAFADDMFLRRHRGLGAPVINQLVWCFERAPEEDAVRALNAALARGALARRARAAVLPAARGRWVADPVEPPLEVTATPLTTDGLRDWVEACGRVPLDPRSPGDGWRLSLARLDDGGAVLSLVVPHAVADGSAMVDAVVRAGAGRPLELPAETPRLLRPLADARDVAGQLGEVARWAAPGLRRMRKRLGGGPVETPAPAPAPPAPPAPRQLPAEGAGWQPSWLVAEVDAAAVQALATTLGGSVNAWFAAASAGLVRRTGRFTETDVPVALPVSGRGSEDLRGNATRIARVRLEDRALRESRLDLVKKQCRTAYADLEHAREPLPLALVQMLPDAAVRRLPPAPAAAALASNVGVLPPEFTTIGGVGARRVMALVHQQQLTVEEAAATGGGLITFLVGAGQRLSLTVAAFDPFAVSDAAALREIVQAELAHWQSLAGTDLGVRLW
ncbi:hypothetical protein JK386_13595 [Nocardioides sp. zg-536]|uniref:Condensation domain-containing protein n=1 Tax=Nocardioides faecalis TaxID=2803858 RepID=A0A939BZ38_9ACTN|nr:hypothetical protein [Nocardioides faecalis]MBM9460933.1 hypothetical protein [Nocardioides faecalis]QVI59242.1 hypothetical protein KG111_02370 [Nocardioides faecalis]